VGECGLGIWGKKEKSGWEEKTVVLRSAEGTEEMDEFDTEKTTSNTTKRKRGWG